MKPNISFPSIKTGLFLLLFLICGSTIFAAQFTADLIVTSPGAEIVYDLKVKDNMYRMEKVKGLEQIPALPFIYNRTTKISWGLNPQMKQYIEETDPAKTMMMNPIAGWEFMRQELESTPAGSETIQGYSCRILEFRQKGDTRISNSVWVSPELDFTLKEVSHALNGDATLTLMNIKKGPVDPALFEIPQGYVKADVPAKAEKKAAGALRTIAETLKGEAPWGRRISAGGEIQVKVDPRRPVKIVFVNQNKGASSGTYSIFREGEEQTPAKTGHISLTKKGKKTEVTIDNLKKPEWVFIQVEEGLIYASLANERDPFSSDRYKLQEGYLTVKGGQGLSVDPARKLIITIEGDCQDSPNSEISLVCYQQQYADKVFEKKVTVPNKETKTWEFMPNQKIQTCEILVGKTGGVKYKVEQPELVK